MKKICLIKISIILAMYLLFFCVFQHSAMASDVSVRTPIIFDDPALYVENDGEILIRYRDSLDVAKIEGLCEVEEDPENQLICCKVYKQTDIETCLTAFLQQKDKIEVIQPNYNFSLQSGTEYKESESEVLLSGNNVEKQWAIKNDGSFVSPGKYEQELHIKTVSGMDLEAPKAWELIDQEGAQKHKVVVAVLDTGIDTGHEDLQNILWQNPGEKSDGIDNDGNGYADDVNGWDFAEGRSNISDSVGHGTRVAGIISARRNETGICGIAAYDEIRIMPLKVFNKKGETDTFSVIRAIQYAEKCGARICNCSWGYIRSSNPDDNDILLEQTIRQSGMLFVTASGNKGENNDDIHMIPANIECDHVLSVGSIEWDGSLSWFSNYGKSKVDLCAPGAAIISTCPSGYDYDWGTSMATPYVTGIAATMCMLRPTLSNEQIRKLMLDESNLKKIEGLREYCVSGGIPNMEKLIHTVLELKDQTERIVEQPKEDSDSVREDTNPAKQGVFDAEKSAITKVVIDRTTYVYNGKVQKPVVAAVYAGSRKLDKGDYTVVYSNEKSKDAGKYTISVKGVRGYLGILSKSYRIRKKKRSLKTIPGRIRVNVPADKDYSRRLKLRMKGKDVRICYRSNSKKLIVSKQGKMIVRKGIKEGIYVLYVSIGETKNYKPAKRKIKIIVKKAPQ